MQMKSWAAFQDQVAAERIQSSSTSQIQLSFQAGRQPSVTRTILCHLNLWKLRRLLLLQNPRTRRKSGRQGLWSRQMTNQLSRSKLFAPSLILLRQTKKRVVKIISKLHQRFSPRPLLRIRIKAQSLIKPLSLLLRTQKPSARLRNDSRPSLLMVRLLWVVPWNSLWTTRLSHRHGLRLVITQ